MSGKKFAELLNDWGFERVPKELMQHDSVFCCDPVCIGGCFHNKVLYTDLPTKFTGSNLSMTAYSRFVESFRNRCYCRNHFEKMYQEN